MLWEKKISTSEKRGYLYIRESQYNRDKRTLRRKPPHTGNGSAYKNRWKYTKKVDIYCGRIIDDVELKDKITFREYIEKNLNQEFLEYKTNSQFDKILHDFVKYLLTIHNLNIDNFYNGKKKAYAIASGYLSIQTIKKVEEFIPKSSNIDYKELERFANKCLDAAIYDDEVIMLLYSKLLPHDYLDEEVEEEYKKIPKSYQSFKDFIGEQHE